MRASVAWALLSMLLAALPARAAETPAEKAAAAMLEADRGMNRAVQDKDRERFASFVARDATFLGGGLARGREAVLADWAPLLAPDRKTTLRWDPQEAHVASSADLGYTMGEFTLETTDDAGGREIKKGHYVTVWRKQADGSWQAVADAGSPAQPVKPKE